MLHKLETELIRTVSEVVGELRKADADRTSVVRQATEIAHAFWITGQLDAALCEALVATQESGPNGVSDHAAVALVRDSALPDVLERFREDEFQPNRADYPHPQLPVVIDLLGLAVRPSPRCFTAKAIGRFAIRYAQDPTYTLVQTLDARKVGDNSDPLVADLKEFGVRILTGEE